MNYLRSIFTQLHLVTLIHDIILLFFFFFFFQHLQHLLTALFWGMYFLLNLLHLSRYIGFLTSITGSNKTQVTDYS